MHREEKKLLPQFYPVETRKHLKTQQENKNFHAALGHSSQHRSSCLRYKGVALIHTT